jgi:hypothetical protein
LAFITAFWLEAAHSAKAKPLFHTHNILFLLDILSKRESSRLSRTAMLNLLWSDKNVAFVAHFNPDSPLWPSRPVRGMSQTNRISRKRPGRRAAQ